MSALRGGLSLRTLRVALAGVLAFDLCSLAWFVHEARRFADASRQDPLTLAIATPWASLPIAAVGLVLVARFAGRGGRLAEAGGVLACLATLSHTHAALEGGPWRHLFFSGTCLFGWTLGGIAARRHGAPEDESLARIGAIATLGAAYANAGISKIVYGGGAAWLEGQTLRYTVIAQDGLVGDGPLHALRELVVGVPVIATVFAVATVGFELAGPAMVVGPRTRALVAGGLVSMHLVIFVLTGIPYVESVFLLVLFALPARPGTEPPPGWGPSPRAAAIAGCTLTLVTMVSLARETWPELTPPPPRPVRETPPPPASRVGPLTVGQGVGGSTIAGLEADDATLVVRVTSSEGEVTFDVTCRETPHAGPWDRPPLHVFYRRTERSIDALAPVVNALVDAMGEEPCASLPRWLREAR